MHEKITYEASQGELGTFKEKTECHKYMPQECALMTTEQEELRHL